MTTPPESDDIALKKEYAAALLRWPDDPVKAAQSVVGGDTQRAIQISIRWPRDPVVVAHKEELIEEHGAEAFTLSKAELINKLVTIADGERVDAKDRIAALAKVAEIRGFIEKPGTKVEINNVAPRVMLVRDSGSDDDWERKLAEQQRKLTDDAAEKTH